MFDPKDIGAYDRRVTIGSTGAASGSSVIDDFGDADKTFGDLFSCWAGREEAGSNQETDTANRTILPESYNYYMHYRSNVTASMILTDDDVVFRIKSVTPLERKMLMRLAVEKIIE